MSSLPNERTQRKEKIMATTLYLVVSGKGTRQEVGGYMYSTSTLVQESDFDSVREVASIWQITADSAEHADFLTKYQVGRMQSGLFGCSVFDTLKEATEWYATLRSRAIDIVLGVD